MRLPKPRFAQDIRLSKHSLRCAVRDKHSLIEDKKMSRKPCDVVHIVRDENDRRLFPAMKCCDHRKNFLPTAWVKPRRRLVENKVLGTQGEDARDRDATHLPARQGKR